MNPYESPKTTCQNPASEDGASRMTPTVLVAVLWQMLIVVASMFVPQLRLIFHVALFSVAIHWIIIAYVLQNRPQHGDWTFADKLAVRFGAPILFLTIGLIQWTRIG